MHSSYNVCPTPRDSEFIISLLSTIVGFFFFFFKIRFPQIYHFCSFDGPRQLWSIHHRNFTIQSGKLWLDHVSRK